MLSEGTANSCSGFIIPGFAGGNCKVKAPLFKELKEELLNGEGRVDVYVVIDGEMGIACRRIIENHIVQTLSMYPPVFREGEAAPCVHLTIPVSSADGVGCALGDLHVFTKGSDEGEVCGKLLS